jgi:cytochrome c peroxidase
VALTAPYMHDGRFATLDAVLEHYSAIGARVRGAAAVTGGSLGYDPRLPRSPFTDAERAELRKFLQSLTDESFVSRFAASRAPAVP